MTFPEERAVITKILQGCSDPACIVDLGAHEGEDTEWMLGVVADKHPQAIMIEADPVNFALLAKRNLPGTAWWGAVAAHTGTCEFWENRASGGGFGSIYEPDREQLSVDRTQWRKSGLVPCWTFDELFKIWKLDHIDLLWVDIHGAEKDMITHGQEALQHTHFLFMEAFDRSLYAGAATATELQSMLPGWSLQQVFPWNLLLRNENWKGPQ